MATGSLAPLGLTPEEARISAELAQDRPTIDTAVKSFLSLICARGMTASSVMVTHVDGAGDDRTDLQSSSKNKNHSIVPQPTNAQALQVARLILQSCNQYRFPIHKTVVHVMGENPNMTEDKKMELLELSVVARLWNGLMESNQKPTRFLGRNALIHAWHDMQITMAVPHNHPVQPSSQESSDPELTTIDASDHHQVQQQQQLALIQEFERYLFYSHPSTEDGKENDHDNDAALIWDADGGQAELNRRRLRRQSAAIQRNDTS